jgi:hypothetical protein
MNRLYREIIINFERLEKMPILPKPAKEKVYKQKDYTEESVATLYRNFKNGLIERYLSEEAERSANAPILSNPTLKAELLLRPQNCSHHQN